MTTASPYKTTDFVGFDEQRDAAAFAAALQPEEPQLQFVGSAVNPFPGALDVLFFRGVLLVVRSHLLIPLNWISDTLLSSFLGLQRWL